MRGSGLKCSVAPTHTTTGKAGRRTVLLPLFLLFTLLPVVELFILFRLAAWLDWGPTLLIVLGTGAGGAYLARREGLRALVRVRQDLADGNMPATAVVDAVLIFAAGLVLVTPGVLTDLAGLLLLIRPVRARVGRALVDFFHKRVTVLHGDHTSRDEFIDVEVTHSETKQRATFAHDQDENDRASTGDS